MRKKKTAGFLMGLLTLALTAVAAWAASGDLYDQADLFNSLEEEGLQEEVQQLSDKWQRDFVLVTTGDAQGKTSQEYADDFFDDHGYGTTGKNSGVLLLVDMDNREIAYSAYGDMMLYLTDQRGEQLLDAGYEGASRGDYYTCFRSMLSSVNSYLTSGVPDDQYTYDAETGKLVRQRRITWVEALIAVAAAAAVSSCSMLVIRRQHRLKDNLYQYPFRVLGHVALSRREDQFRNQIVTTRRIPCKRGPGPGGGPGGGRTTVHTSSSGRVHSGGSRKF